MGYNKLKDYLWDNIEDTINMKKNPSEIDMHCLGMAVDMLKDIATIEAMRNYGGNESEYYPESFADRRGMTHYRSEPMMIDSMRRSPTTGRYVSRDGGTMAQLTAMYENAANEHERANMQKLMDFAKNNLDNY